MADCTVAQVLTKAMNVLGDPSGEITQEIIDDFGTTYLDLLLVLMKIEAPDISREVYYSLPASTGVLAPSSLGVTDFAEPVQIWERGNVSQVAVTSTTDGTPITVTLASNLPFGTGSQVELNSITGVPGYVNRDWFITATGPTTFTLNGSVRCGSNGTGGNAMFSSDRFQPMTLQDDSPGAGTGILPQTLGTYRWQNGFIYFNGANQTRQLWIEYLSNGTPPSSGTIGLCEGKELNFLSYGTAARFAPKRAIVQGPQIALSAYGESGQPDGTGGMLRELIIPILKQQQNRPMRSGMFRRRRTPLGFVM